MKKPFRKTLIQSVAWVLVLSYLSGSFTKPALKPWYENLQKSSLTPPSWAFPLVWTLLYIMIAVAVALIIQQSNKNKSIKLKYFFVQLGLNFLWTPVFFGLKQPLMGLIIIAGLVAAILQNIFYYKKFVGQTIYLLIPYLIWVCFAFYLNLFIYLNN